MQVQLPHSTESKLSGNNRDFHSAVGKDADGDTILNNLKKLEVNTTGVQVIENHLTMVKTGILDLGRVCWIGPR